MKYLINNPKSEQKLIPLQKTFLFRPDQQSLYLKKTCLGCSDNRFRNELFWLIQQFYDWLQSNANLYEEELINKGWFTKINRQALFQYFLFNIQIKVSQDKLSFEFIIPTSLQFQDNSNKRQISQQLLEELSTIYKCEFDKNKKQVDMLSSAIYNELKNHSTHHDFRQFFRTETINIQINAVKKFYLVVQANQLVLQQNGDIIKSKFNQYKTITLSKSEIFHNHKPFFSTHQYFASFNRLRSFGDLNLNFDRHGQTTVYSDQAIIYEGQMSNGFLEGSGKFYNRDKQLIYDGSLSGNTLHGQGTIFHQYGYMSGQFKNDMMHGQFHVYDSSQIHYFERNVEVRALSSGIMIQEEGKYKKIANENSIVTFSQVCTYKDYYVHIAGYLTFHPGKWLFETMVDYFIEYFRNTLTSREGQLQTQIHNTDQTSDFLNGSPNLKNTRHVFAHNYNRSHFMLMILDQGNLYCCDSLYSSKPDLEQKFCKLLGLRTSSAIRLNCTQQQNGYDCGIFASYYALQFMKYDKLSIQEVEKKLVVKNISEIRWQLCQLIKNNHNFILTNF